MCSSKQVPSVGMSVGRGSESGRAVADGLAAALADATGADGDLAEAPDWHAASATERSIQIAERGWKPILAAPSRGATC